jgi:hypothetical protein
MFWPTSSRRVAGEPIENLDLAERRALPCGRTSARRATPRRETKVARRRYQAGCLFKRGRRRKVWVARWREDVLLPDGTPGRLQRSLVLGLVSKMPTQRQARALLDQQLRSINEGRHQPQSLMSFSAFAEGDWTNLVMANLKLSTQRG